MSEQKRESPERLEGAQPPPQNALKLFWRRVALAAGGVVLSSSVVFGQPPAPAGADVPAPPRVSGLSVGDLKSLGDVGLTTLMFDDDPFLMSSGGSSSSSSSNPCSSSSSSAAAQVVRPVPSIA